MPMMGETEPMRGVVVRDQPVVDFSHLTSPEQWPGISRIEDVALVVVPQSLAGAYAAISTSDVGATIYVPGGVNVRVHTGALVVGGDGIGGAGDMLVVIGMLVITSPVTAPLPQRIYAIGSVLAPRGSEPVLGRPGRRPRQRRLLPILEWPGDQGAQRPGAAVRCRAG